MGEAADMMLDGLCCQCCGEFIDGEETGYPRYCAGCEPEVEFVMRVSQDDRARNLAQKAAMNAAKAGKKTRQAKPKEWSTELTIAVDFAMKHDLAIVPRNPYAPNYEIAILRGEGVCLVIYPHTVVTTGNKHARIRDQNSINKDRARYLMLASGLKVRLGGLP